MKALQDRKTAWIIAILLIICSFFGGGAKTLNGMRAKTADMFLNGTGGDGMSIQNDLNHRVDYAYNFITVANRYIQNEAAVEALAKARQELIEADGVTAKFKANLHLTEASEALYERLCRPDLSMTEADAKYRESLYADLKARNNIIYNDGYNNKAQEFNRLTERFPASLIKTLGLVKELPLFL